MSSHPKRRRRALAGITLVVVLAGGAGTFVAFRNVDDSAAESSDSNESNGSESGTSTAEVVRRDLEAREGLSGTLGYGEQTDVTLAATGTITALPALGTIVDRGQMLVEVDGRAVPLWLGDRPLWRSLDINADDGVDIEQVEYNLVALGFAPSSTLTVDQDWTAATTTALKKWQKSIGREQTGVLNVGDVAVLPAAVRIAAHPTAVGGQAAGPVAKVTAASRQVTVDLEATKQSLVTKGQPVTVELPGGNVVDGTITSVGTVAKADENDDPLNPSAPTIEVIVSLADASQAGALDEAPVTVQVVTSAAKDVLAVPVDALLALAEGGYAVERVGAGGGHKLVKVSTGAFADGWVEITGTVAAGDKVVVPA